MIYCIIFVIIPLYTISLLKCQCQCQSEFVNVAKIAKLFRNRKTAGRQTVVAITQEMTSEGMSLDVDRRQAEKGKTEHSAGMNSIERMLQRKTKDGRQSIDGMVERAAGVSK